jgi:hypothetical protein
MSSVGKYELALGQLKEYIAKYPKGYYRADAKYRTAVCYYAASQYEDVIKLCNEWLAEFEKDDMRGEVGSLLGDALAATNRNEEAARAYVASYKVATTDEVMTYSLFEASKQIAEGRAVGTAELFVPGFCHRAPGSCGGGGLAVLDRQGQGQAWTRGGGEGIPGRSTQEIYQRTEAGGRGEHSHPTRATLLEAPALGRAASGDKLERPFPSLLFWSRQLPPPRQLLKTRRRRRMHHLCCRGCLQQLAPIESCGLRACCARRHSCRGRHASPTPVAETPPKAEADTPAAPVVVEPPPYDPYAELDKRLEPIAAIANNTGKPACFSPTQRWPH